LSRKTITYRDRASYKIDSRIQAANGFQAIENENLRDGKVKILYVSGNDMILDPPQRTVTDSQLLDEVASERNVERI